MEEDREFEEIEKPFEHLPNGLSGDPPDFNFGMDPKPKAVEEEVEVGFQLPKANKNYGRPQRTVRLNAHVCDSLDMYMVNCGFYDPDKPIVHKKNPSHGYSYTEIIECVLRDNKKYSALKKAVEDNK